MTSKDHFLGARGTSQFYTHLLRVNSSISGKLNSTGNLLSINYVDLSFPHNNSWKILLPQIHFYYSGILFSIELFSTVIVDELMESAFSTNSVEFSYFSIKFVRENIPVEFGLPLVDEFIHMYCYKKSLKIIH